MTCNIFLTGKKRIGKTTIIKKVIRELNLNPGGFMVGRTVEEGKWTSFFLVDAGDFIYSQEHREKPPVERKNVFASRDCWFNRKVYPEVFDTSGVEMLEKGLKEKEIIIMDELGRFELNSFKFQNSVRKVLKSSVPVLGVIKDEENPFLDEIRKREDVNIFRVNEENREDICRIIMEILRKFVDF